MRKRRIFGKLNISYGKKYQGQKINLERPPRKNKKKEEKNKKTEKIRSLKDKSKRFNKEIKGE